MLNVLFVVIIIGFDNYNYNEETMLRFKLASNRKEFNTVITYYSQPAKLELTNVNVAILLF